VRSRPSSCIPRAKASAVDEMVNLVVDLHDARFDERGYAEALRAIEHAGFAVGESSRDDGRVLAWIDDEFGGAWSSEAFAGTSVVARSADAIAGFATFDSRDLRFAWLRGLGAQPDVGVFGPFGVGRTFRKSGIGPHLLVAALCGLRARGYARALIPAVGEEKLIEYYEHNSGAVVAERFEKSAWQKKRFRTVVMASGDGSNFQAVLERSRDGQLPLDIRAVICNVADARVLERARTADVPARVVAWDRAAEMRAAYDAGLLGAVRSEEPELVLLLGWMHLFDEAFVAAFEDAINLHPSFLPLDSGSDEVTMPDGSVQPAFRGAHSLRDALGAGVGWTGASAHLLGMQTDRGRVLARKPLRIAHGSVEVALREAVYPIEQRVVAGAIMRWVYER
jgi:phosphoribosylglycinamide formyltransferase-1